MKKTALFTLIFGLLGNVIFSQELILHKDFPGITWPLLWDMEQDDEGNLYVCSEQGILYVKSNGEWQEYDLNINSQADARSLAIDKNGILWIGTEEGLYSFSNNQVLDHFTSANSTLPSDDLREIRALDNQLWINLKGNGLAIKEGNTFTHLTQSNSNLASDFVDDIEITQTGEVIIASDEIVQFVSGNNWSTFNFDNMFGFQTWVYDIFIDYNQDVWFGTWTGVIKYNSAINKFEDLKATYGKNKYTAIIYTPKNELWLGELFEGLHYYDDQNNNFFFDGNIDGQPSQVFDFIYYQDTVRVIGNIGATVTGLTVDISSSITEVSTELLLIYPNPSTNYIKIDVIGLDNYSLLIHSLDGQILYMDYNITEVDLSKFNGGSYFLQLVDEKNRVLASKKIVISK